MNPVDSSLELAIRELRFTTSLTAEDPRYIERRDRLGQRLLNRILAPSANRLLLAGPAGCGKSTELRRIHQGAGAKYMVVLCPCDREIDLHRLTRSMLLGYVLIRIIDTCTAPPLSSLFKLSSDILRDAAQAIETSGALEAFGINARPSNLTTAFEAVGIALHSFLPIKVSGPAPRVVDDDFRMATVARLCAEIEMRHERVLLLVDGLEKVAPEALADVVSNGFIRSPALRDCHSVIVIPHWSVFGWRAQALYQDTEVFEVTVDDSPEFVEAVVERRAPGVFEPDIREEVARLSGGVVRDGLQLGHGACRAAIDDFSPRVGWEHVARSRREVLRTYVNIFSDDPVRAREFLRHVRERRELPGDPEWRDRVLASGAVLPRPDGTFRVHPVLDDSAFLQGALQ